MEEIQNQIEERLRWFGDVKRIDKRENVKKIIGNEDVWKKTETMF
jgi:hypothetical protein